MSSYIGVCDFFISSVTAVTSDPSRTMILESMFLTSPTRTDSQLPTGLNWTEKWTRAVRTEPHYCLLCLPYSTDISNKKSGEARVFWDEVFPSMESGVRPQKFFLKFNI